jgi:malonyl-CoA O-methyltransferase
MAAHFTDDEYSLDTRAVRRAFDRASASFADCSQVHAEIRTRLLERLDVVQLTPAVVVDLGAAHGAGAKALGQRYRSARVIAIDLSQAMLRRAARQQGLLRKFARLTADAQHLPLADASVDLLFSNLMLQWCPDPDAVLRELRRVLRSGALLAFTTLGPDTLKELRQAWSSDDHVHVHRFIDMHDLGDALLRAGLADPVMDTERLTVTYPDLAALERELKGSGSCNLAAGRRRGLNGRHCKQAAHARYETLRHQHVLPVSLEVVYGHAWVGQRKPSSRPEEVRIPLTALRRRIDSTENKT